MPDTNNKAGLGHLFRCLKYSNFIKKPNKIIFLIKKNLQKKTFIKQNVNKIKIKYIYFNNLKKTLSLIKNKHKNIITFLDSYNYNLQNYNFRNFSKKHINILDFKMPFTSDYAIDHTYKRNFKYHKNNNIHIGVNFFPIFSRLSILKKTIILISFGSVKDKTLIKKSLLFLKKLKLKKKLTIVVISKNFTKKDLTKIKLENKIILYKFVNNIENLYQKVLFSFGACGISLYEKCFYTIPCISKCLAKNQYFNFKNFNSNSCILDFDRVTKLNINDKKERKYFFDKIFNVKKNIRKNFNYKNNKKNLTYFFKKINEN
jgi:spore coat polysaccharide biosynthesis predicted glycosyltransferase SpsG